MNETNSSATFVGYEYKDVTVRRDIEHLYIDNYQNFGWNIENVSHSSKGLLYTVLRFKRDRKIGKKMEITRLQRQFESCVKDIQHLEQSKYVSASTAAYTVGIAGSAFMAGSVFAYLAGYIILTILLAVPAFAGWVLPYFLFIKIRNRKIETITPLVDNQYEVLYTVCEKAFNLQSNS